MATVIRSGPGVGAAQQSEALAAATLALSSTATLSGNLIQGSNETDRVTIKGIYMTPSNVSVSVPSISDNDTGEVAVDVSSAFDMAPAVGDAVIAIPQEALPTDCSLAGAWVSDDDEVTVSFTAQDGAVTGASKNFKFVVIDLT